MPDASIRIQAHGIKSPALISNISPTTSSDSSKQ